MNRPVRFLSRRQQRLALLLLLPFLLVLRSPNPQRAEPTVLTGVEPRYTLSRPGAVIELSGENLPSRGLVMVGSTPAPKTRWVDPKRLRVSLPSHLSAGTFPVRVISPDRGEAQLPHALTVLSSATSPVLDSMSPDRRRAGETVLLHGQNFTADAEVSINGRPCTTEFESSTCIRVHLPRSLDPGIAELRLRAAEGESVESSELLTIIE